MNKIKIINEDILHVMQSTAKQYRVNEQVKRYSQEHKRPKTPQQIFNNVIKEAVSSDIHLLRKNQLKTNSVIRSRMQWSQTKLEKYSSPFVIEKKIDTRSSKLERPMTSTNLSKIQRQRQRKSETIDINELKSEINEVLTEIKEEGELFELRKLKRFTQYREKKFGKFWNSYKLKLDKKMYSANSYLNEIQSKSNIAKVSSKNFNLRNKINF